MRSGTNARFIEHIDPAMGSRLVYSAFDTHGAGRTEQITVSVDYSTAPECATELTRTFLRDAGASDATELRGAILLPAAPGPEGFAPIEAAIEAMRSLPTMPGPVVAVARDPTAWRGVHGFDGFVAARPGVEVQTTASLGMLLSALSAPTMLSCVDDADLLMAVGTADAPSHLVQATWRPSGLEVSDEADSQALKDARVICLLPVARLLKLSDYREMTADVRGRWAPDAELISIVTVEFLPDSTREDGLPCLALCR